MQIIVLNQHRAEGLHFQAESSTSTKCTVTHKYQTYRLQARVYKYRLMHGCFHIGFHIRPDSSYLPDEGGQIWILIFDVGQI
jgi:hypothetical protein